MDENEMKWPEELAHEAFECMIATLDFDPNPWLSDPRDKVNP
jgi:hypothetical protein